MKIGPFVTKGPKNYIYGPTICPRCSSKRMIRDRIEHECAGPITESRHEFKMESWCRDCAWHSRIIFDTPESLESKRISAECKRFIEEVCWPCRANNPPEVFDIFGEDKCLNCELFKNQSANIQLADVGGE